MRFASIATAALLTFLPFSAQAASFVGQFWDSPTGFGTVDQAIAYADNNAVTGTFTSTTIDYPNGSTGSMSDYTSITTFLGVDGLSYSGVVPSNLKTSVIRISGTFVPGAGSKTYSVGSDDGFALTVGGTEISRYSNPRGFRYTNVNHDAGSGPVDFVLTYYENYGYTGLHFKIDGQTVTNAIAAPSSTPAPVPVPAALPLLAGALGALGIARRRAKS